MAGALAAVPDAAVPVRTVLAAKRWGLPARPVRWVRSLYVPKVPTLSDGACRSCERPCWPALAPISMAGSVRLDSTSSVMAGVHR